MMWLLAALVLAPHLAEDGALRLVSDGTGEAPVDWYLDGIHVAATRDGEPAHVNATAGDHTLWATTEATGPWRILARAAPVADDVAYVPAWTAASEAEVRPSPEMPDWVLPAAIALLGAGIVLWPKDP